MTLPVVDKTPQCLNAATLLQSVICRLDYMQLLRENAGSTSRRAPGHGC